MFEVKMYCFSFFCHTIHFKWCISIQTHARLEHRICSSNKQLTHNVINSLQALWWVAGHLGLLHQTVPWFSSKSTPIFLCVCVCVVDFRKVSLKYSFWIYIYLMPYDTLAWKPVTKHSELLMSSFGTSKWAGWDPDVHHFPRSNPKNRRIRPGWTPPWLVDLVCWIDVLFYVMYASHQIDI